MDTLSINDKTIHQQFDMVVKNQVLGIIDQIGEPPEDKIEVGEVVSNKEDKERIRKYSTMKAAVLCGL